MVWLHPAPTGRCPSAPPNNPKNTKTLDQGSGSSQFPAKLVECHQPPPVFPQKPATTNRASSSDDPCAPYAAATKAAAVRGAIAVISIVNIPRKPRKLISLDDWLQLRAIHPSAPALHHCPVTRCLACSNNSICRSESSVNLLQLFDMSAAIAVGTGHNSPRKSDPRPGTGPGDNSAVPPDTTPPPQLLSIARRKSKPCLPLRAGSETVFPLPRILRMPKQPNRRRADRQPESASISTTLFRPKLPHHLHHTSDDGP